jgi:hypothetical protein
LVSTSVNKILSEVINVLGEALVGPYRKSTAILQKMLVERLVWDSLRRTHRAAPLCDAITATIQRVDVRGNSSPMFFPSHLVGKLGRIIYSESNMATVADPSGNGCHKTSIQRQRIIVWLYASTRMINDAD